MSTVETVPRQFFRSYVAQVHVDVPQHLTISQDDLPLVVRLIKRIQRRSAIDDSVPVFQQNEVARRSFLLIYSNIKRLSTRTAYTTLLTDTLSGLGVPQVEQPDIIQKTFCLVDETAVPELHVDVCISDIIEYFSENSIGVADNESNLIQTVARESMETFRAVPPWERPPTQYTMLFKQ